MNLVLLVAGRRVPGKDDSNTPSLSGTVSPGFLGAVADRNYEIERLSNEFVHGLGPLVRDVNPAFVHDRYRFRANLRRLRASGVV
jgi:hypothetical protein